MLVQRDKWQQARGALDDVAVYEQHGLLVRAQHDGVGVRVQKLGNDPGHAAGCVLSDQLGKEESNPASHVRFRPLKLYEKKLVDLGFKIEVVEPVYTLLNGGVGRITEWAPRPVRSLVYRLVHRSEEALAPAMYVLERVPGVAHWANMRILVAQNQRG